MNEFHYHFCKFKTIKGMSFVDPMIFFSNLLFIHQWLCANIDGGESDDGSEYVYAEEQLMDDIKHLQDGTEQELNLKCARIMKYLKELNDQTLRRDYEREAYKNLQTFYHELPKAIQFVYEAEKFSLYFSAQQEDNAEPMGGLKLCIDETQIEMMKGVFKELDRVYLTVVVRSSLQNLSDVDLSDTMQEFDFVTDLYLLNLTYEYTSWIYESCNTVQNFLNLETIPRLRTLKVKHMLVMDEFLEKVGKMTLECLSFTGCTFITFKDTVQQRKEIEVTFAKSYKTICFNKCKRCVEYRSSYALGRKYSMAIKINLNKCVKLRNLTVNRGDYASVILSKQIVRGLRYLSLGKNYFELPLSSSQCYSARLEYLVIDTENLELAVKFLGKINRSKLKHLVLICYILGRMQNVFDVSDLFNLEFAALEVLEIDTGYHDLGLNSRLTSGIKTKKLETLRINCWCVDKELMQMITKFEMLKHLEIFMFVFADVSYELLWRQLPNLKGPIEKLFVSSKLTINELVRSIEPLHKLKEFYMDARSIQSSVDSLTNQNDDKFQPAKVDLNGHNLVESKDVVHLKLHTLHISMSAEQIELIKLISRRDFEAFAGIKRLVIFEAPTDPYTWLEKIQRLSEISLEQLNNLIESVFETFKQLEVFVICYKRTSISEEGTHILRKLFSVKCRSLKERCEWSDKCDGERTIFELYR